MPAGKVPGQVCTAHTSSGKPCKRWAIVGGTVCPTHGGSAPQVREAARRRIAGFVPRALQEMERLAQGAESEAVRVRALIDLLDRAGLKAPDEHVLIPSDAPNEDLDARIMAALEARAAGLPHTAPHTGDA